MTYINQVYYCDATDCKFCCTKCNEIYDISKMVEEPDSHMCKIHYERELVEYNKWIEKQKVKSKLEYWFNLSEESRRQIRNIL